MNERPLAVAERDSFLPPISIEVAEEGTMPDQPADPIHYDMKIPPEPTQPDDEEHSSTKKHGDKINTGTGPSEKDAPREEKKGDS
jgi:hypothetical protein